MPIINKPLPECEIRVRPDYCVFYSKDCMVDDVTCARYHKFLLDKGFITEPPEPVKYHIIGGTDLETITRLNL